jgi:hypothetical protein
VLPIDGVAMDLVVCLDRSKSMGRYWPIVIVRPSFLICACAMVRARVMCAHARGPSNPTFNGHHHRKR